MTPEDDMDLLPPLPSPSDLAITSLTVGEGATGGASPLVPITISDEEFSAVLRGNVLEAQAPLAVPEAVPPNAAIAGEEGIRAQAAGEGAAGVDAGAEVVPARSAEILNCYTAAAALRYTYRVDTLTPLAPQKQVQAPPRYGELDRERRGEVFAWLTGHSEIVTDVSGNARWMLQDAERRTALKTLIERHMIQEAIEQARADAVAEVQEDTKAGVVMIGAEGRGAARRVEEMLWLCLSGQVPVLEALDRPQLLMFQRVVGWLYELVPSVSVPAPEAVMQRLAHETLLQPFRHLTGEWQEDGFVSYFIGRVEELTRLYHYLAIRPPTSLWDQFGRVIQKLADSTWRLLRGEIGHRPLLIYGPGGVGKSTLLAKFLLDHLEETDSSNRFPYAYLDFDLSSLSSREPVTLLAEAARQLATQYPSPQGTWNMARTEWLGAIQHSGANGLDPTTRQGMLERFTELLVASESGGVRVAEQFERGLPFLLVLDTFEEMQHQDRDAVKDIFRFLNELRRHVTALRVIIMGRAPLDDVRQEHGALEAIAVEGDVFGTGLTTGFDVIQVPLGDLSLAEARQYLSRQGIADPELAEELVEAVGSSPLSLRLIARVLRDGEIDPGSLRAEMQWRPNLGDWWHGRKIPPKALLQGVLFRRILGHIHDKDVRALAHPGLILRRITPELIKKVLAEPCGLGAVDEAQAEHYFRALEREVSLVGTDPDSRGEVMLRHRPELRRIMLRLMETDEEKQGQIRQVHVNALHYYETQQGRTAREEALYHRLMLGDLPHPEALLDDVPTEEAVEAGYVSPTQPDADPRIPWHALADVLEELPLAAGTYLAARLHRELVPDAAWESADRRDRELMILGRASRRARERSSLITAIEGLRRDRDRMLQGHKQLSPLSPLPLIEVALLERLGRFREAERHAEEALSHLRAMQGHPRRETEYSLLGARVAARLKAVDRCREYLIAAEKGIFELGDGDESATKAAHRCDRQLLRVATDCYHLQPTRWVSDHMANCLFRLKDTGLQGYPVLARYGLASTASTLEALHLHMVLRYAELFDFTQTTTLLPILLDRLPPGTAVRTAEALARWSIGALADGANEEAFMRVVPLPVERQNLQRVRDAWLTRLLDPSTQFAARLVELFLTVTISCVDLAELYRTLMPVPTDGTSGEDPYEEARRAGDLIPGEGPVTAEDQDKVPR